MGGRGRGRGRGGGKEKEKGEGERIGRRRERGFRGGIRVKEGEGERISEGGDGGWEMVEGIEVGDKVMLEVSSWKDVEHLEKKEMLAPIYKYLTDTNLHVHLEEIKVDKTLCFVEKHVEIIEREVKSLKRSRIPIVKSIGTRSKCWTDANLHMHLEEIKIAKTLCFAEEPVEIIDREVKRLKRSRISIVKSIGTRSEVMRIS
ncbi:hypothetical protein Tco_0658808 [Tanacetum coccineum]